MPADIELPLFTHWTTFLKWLLQTTEKFPKRIRFTFSQRIENLALDIVEDLVQAQYSKRKTELLRRINLNLEKLRILVRICFEMRHLSGNQYEYASRQINEAGSMVGGWLKQQKLADRV